MTHPDIAREQAADPSALARAITHLTDPAVVILLLLGLVGGRSGLAGLAWAVLIAALVVVAPNLYIAWSVRTGRATDLRLVVRQQRLWPTVLAMLGIVVSLVLLVAVPGPRGLLTLVVALLCGTAVGLVLNHWTKVSAHAAVAAAGAVQLGLLFGPWVFGLAGLLALGAAWSRVRLGRHSVAQVMLGLIVGVVVVGGVLAFMP